MEVTQSAENKAIPDDPNASKDGGENESTSTATPLLFIIEKKKEKKE